MSHAAFLSSYALALDPIMQQDIKEPFHCMQAVVEGYSNGYDPDSMLFMDFRRHHTGLWGDTATRCADLA